MSHKQSQASVAWARNDAEFVNRLLRPYVEKKKRERQRRAEAEAMKKKKRKRILEKLIKHREVLEKHDGDRWLATTAVREGGGGTKIYV